jgi:DNA polymerase III epsilon subunit
MGLFSLFSQPLAKESYVFFDVETTGLYPLNGDRILEIAMLRMKNGEQDGSLHLYLNPGFPIPEEVTRINHITDDRVKDAPSFNQEIAEEIISFIGSGIIVAHNAPFDLSFLSKEMGDAGVIFEGWTFIDSLKIATSIFPGQKNNLGTLMRRYNIKESGELHSADFDTLILQKVFFEMLDETEIRDKSIDMLISKFGYKGLLSPRLLPPVIRESMIERKPVSGQYKKRDGEVMPLSFLPVAPVWAERKWFLSGLDVKSGRKIVIYPDHFISFNES